MNSVESFQHLIFENTHVPVLSTIKTNIYHEKLENIIPSNYIKDLARNQKRFFHLRKYIKMETKTSKFSKILIEDYIYDTISEKCYKTSADVTYLSNEPEEVLIPDHEVAKIQKYEITEDKTIFGKFLDV